MDSDIRNRKVQQSSVQSTVPPKSTKPSAEAVAAAMRGSSWLRQNQWIVLAMASGTCAAFNGVFAKLTTNELTTQLVDTISASLGVHDQSRKGGLEVVVRGIFFALNLTFNGVMWALFTMALSRGHSTTQVSIVNTSANFILTAIMGFAIFSEKLPPLWWLGAAMLVAGNVIIGRKDETVHTRPEEGNSNEADTTDSERRPLRTEGVQD